MILQGRAREALYAAIKAEVRRSFSPGRVSERTFEQRAMDEDEYLSSKGVSPSSPHFPGFASPAGHLSGRAKRAGRKQHAQLLAEWQRKANKLRAEYRELVKAGKLRPKGRIEKLMEKARHGHPDNASTHAARRLLIKRGLWDQAMSKQADARFEAVGTGGMTSITKDTRSLILASDYDEVWP